MISRQVIDDILARTDIHQLISSYVQLKRAGSNYSGLCPFHSEKSPSFTVYPSSNSFFCFGCGIGGNAITFIKKAENLDFEDAIESLAQRAGITVVREENESYGAPVKKYDKARFYAMNAEAARFFNRELYRDAPDAKNALAYFTEKRKLSSATIKHFGLGYCPSRYGALAEHLSALGYTEEEMTEGYLCGKSKNGTLFDFFSGRAMFPIIDVSGNVIAFGGRLLAGNGPKYINTSDTPVFKKKRNLFALNYARHTAAQTERMILCEGYMDVVSLHEAGFTDAVATLGTAITPEQARIMKKYANKKIVIAYDTDKAGRAATDKATKLLEEVGLEVKMLKIPADAATKDPDEYIKKFGSDKFRELLGESRTKFDYYFEQAIAQNDISTAQGKIKVLAEMTKLIATYPSASERDIYITSLSTRMGVDKESIKTDVKRAIAKQDRAVKQKENDVARERVLGIGDRVNVDYAKAPAIAKLEETVLALLLLYPNHRSRVFGGKLLTSDDFFTEFGKKVFLFIEKNADAEEMDMLDLEFTPEEVGRLTRLKLDRMELSDNGDTVLTDAIARLRKQMGERQLSGERMSVDSLDDFISNLRNSKK